METATILNGHVAVVFWDIAAFYDSIPLPALCRSAFSLDMPARVFALASQAHLSTRHLRLGQAVAQPVSGMGRSIVAEV